ncbi:MAG: hypothetical protein ACXW2I_18785 [Burkholderiales bacterium]
MTGFFEPVGVQAGLEQRERDQVMLRAAAADAFALLRQRRERGDRIRIVTA